MANRCWPLEALSPSGLVWLYLPSLRVRPVQLSVRRQGRRLIHSGLNISTRATAINNFVNIGPAGLSTRDLYVFSDDVR